jgi:hypothetical protein
MKSNFPQENKILKRQLFPIKYFSIFEPCQRTPRKIACAFAKLHNYSFSEKEIKRRPETTDAKPADRCTKKT